MGNFKEIVRGLEFMSWPERIAWFVVAFGGTTVMTVGPYEVAVSLQGKMLLAAAFLAFICVGAFYRLRYLEERAEPDADTWVLDAIYYLGTGKWGGGDTKGPEQASKDDSSNGQAYSPRGI